MTVYLAVFLKTLAPKRPLPSNSIAIIKTKSATFAFFLLLSSSSFFLFLLKKVSFSFVGMIFELIRRRKPAFWPFFTQVASNFVFKISARYKLMMMMRRRGTVYLLRGIRFR